MALAVLALALAVSSVQAQKPQKISESQCRKIFLSADPYRNRRTPEGTPYCEVHWDCDDDLRVWLGYAFLKTLALPDKETPLIIGVDTRGRIVEVKTEKPTAATEEFLAQFEGRSLTTNFEVAETVDDSCPKPAYE